MKIAVDIVSEEIMQRYNLYDKIHNGYKYVEIRK